MYKRFKDIADRSFEKGMNNFDLEVYRIVQKIPEGKVSTYGDIALWLGDIIASRAVGESLSRNTDSEIPCHRVIRSNGELGGYRLGTLEKSKKLADEGVIIEDGKVNLREFGFNEFGFDESRDLLKKLRDEQTELKDKVILT